MIDTTKYPRISVTADCVIYGLDGEQLKILLIERGIEPFKGMWALPGGFMKKEESIEQTAKRELFEETGLKNVYMTQFKTYSDINRDPRGRVVTVVFMALVKPADYRLAAGDDASNALWFDERYLPPLAFDHAKIIRESRTHLEEMLRLKPIAFELLNKTFSLGELQTVYEVINRTSYDRRNFQRKVMQSGLLGPAEEPEAELDELGFCGGVVLKCEEAVKPRPGRKPSRLFTFRNKHQEDGDSEHSNIRDIFDY